MSFSTILTRFTITSVMAASSSAFAQKDPIPEPPRIAPSQEVGVQKQAGVGGNIAYSRAGVVELGGTISATTAEKYTEVGISPTIGYFFADNVELSGIVNWRYGKVDNTDGRHVASVLVEPSLHIPLSAEQFAFVGLGVGALVQTGVDTGGAIAPRIGFKHLIGRSGMLNVTADGVYGLSRSEVQTKNGTVLTVKSAYNFGVGYTVLL